MAEIPDPIFSHAKFNLDVLLSTCRALRDRACSCDKSQTPKTGSLNWVVIVSFDDGSEWVFRSPRGGYHAILSDESASKLVLSEASTLRYLKANTTIPVPQVYSYSGTWDNDIGVPYILMSKAHGRTVSDYDWAQVSIPGYKSPVPLLPLPDGGREKIMDQLGTMMAQLSGIRFKKIGSLFEGHGGEYSVGECLSASFLWEWRDSLEDIDRGPFSEDDQYLNSLVSIFTAHAKELPLRPHVFFAPIPDHSEYPDWESYRAAVGRWNDFVAIGGKIEGSENRLSYYIAGELLREMVPHISEGDCSFTLSHPDLHTGNIFVDEELNITSIIDWGSATVGPVTELLSTPALGSSFSPPPESVVDAFKSAFNRQCQLEARHWEKANLIWYFSRLVRMLSVQDYKLFRVLYKAVYQVGGDNIPQVFNERASLEHNEQLLAMLREDDISEEEVKQKEDRAFPRGKAETMNRVAVARKLTVMSQISRGFLADERLWRWIQVVFCDVRNPPSLPFTTGGCGV